MAIVQISKIQVRTGAESDLPQLDIGELGFATDTRNAYIGNDPVLDPPVGIQPTLTQLLTDSPNCYINASQITGVLNVDVGNIKIAGGTNGYILQTDGSGNLGWVAGAGGGTGLAGGSNTQIQFNDEGDSTGVSNLTYNRVSHTLTLTGNLIATNVTGNITVAASSQPNITTVGTLVSLDVTGNITSGNATLGNLTVSNYFSGDGSLLTGVAAVTAGTVTASSQSNITTVGTLTGLTVAGVTTLGNVANVKISNGTAGMVLTTDGAGNLSWAAVTSTDLGGFTVFGNANVKSYLNTGFFNTDFVGSIPNATHANYADVANSVAGSNVTGTVAAATISVTVTSSSQPNITSVGTLIDLMVDGDIDAGNISTGNITASYFIGNGRQLSSIAGANVTGIVANAANATFATTAGTASIATVATNAVTADKAATVVNAAQPNITSVGTTFKTIPSMFDDLPTASDAGLGARAFITDANTRTFGSQVDGSGSNNVPVFSDGTDWLVG